MKPREKLIKHGVRALLDAELIAILLRTGSAKNNVFKLSEEVLSLLDALTDLKSIGVEDLYTIHGISDAKATTIIAAVELGRRLSHKAKPNRQVIHQSKDVYHLLCEDMSHLPKEHLIVLCINIKGEVIKNETVYMGTTSTISVAIKDVFKSAVRIGAHGLIVVHNHPSGDSRPSVADTKLTKMMIDAGKLLTIDLLDHIIIGNGEFYSYREHMHTLF